MTGRDKLDAIERRQGLFERDGYICQVCGNPFYQNGQLAHRISKSIMNIKKYGDNVVNHRFNLVSVCSLTCNDKCNIGFQPVKVAELVERIKEDLGE